MSENASETTAPARPWGRSIEDLWLNGQKNTLYPAEWKLLECSARGDWCILGETRPATAMADNRIRAEVLRFIALGGDDRRPLHEHGVQLQGAFVECGPDGLDFEGATLPESLLLNHCKIAGPLILLDASTQTLTFNGCEVAALEGNRLVANGSLQLRNGFVANDHVYLIGAEIHGDFDCSGSTFHNPEKALICDGMITARRVLLSNGFSARGMVRFVGARIGKDLDCRQGRFFNQNSALVLENSMITGDLSLDDEFFTMGTVNLTSAKIGGSFLCSNGTFSSKDNSIHAPRAAIGGNVDMGKECRVAGQVSFQAATIAGDVSFNGGSFEGKPAITLRNAAIGGMLVWRDVEYARGELNLSGASCLTLMMDWKSWDMPEQIRLDNFTYKGFSELPKGCDVEFWRKFLERQPDNHLGEKFRPKPYTQLADVLNTMGHEEESIAIRIEQRRRQSVFTRNYELQSPTGPDSALRLLLIFWDLLKGFLVDYGYRPGKAALYLIAIIGIGSLIYHVAARDGIMTPTHPLIYKEAGKTIPIECAENWVYFPKGAAKECAAKVPSEYSEFNSLIYSIDTALPIVNLRMEADWSPRVVTTKGERYWPGWWVRSWEWLQIALGWLLSLLFVSAIGGIIRR